MLAPFNKALRLVRTGDIVENREAEISTDISNTNAQIELN
jgi:hypothetical protein